MRMSIGYVDPFVIALQLANSFNFSVVSLLTYLLTKKELTPEEVNGLAIDVIFAGVDSVSI